MMLISPTATSLTAAAFIGAAIAVQITDRDPGLLIRYREPVRSEVVAGTELQVQFSAERIRPCNLEFQRSIYDSADTRYSFGAIFTSKSEEPGDDAGLSTVRVPPGAAPGPARYHVNVVARCTVMQDVFPVRFSLPDIPFIIIAKDLANG